MGVRNIINQLNEINYSLKTGILILTIFQLISEVLKQGNEFNVDVEEFMIQIQD